MNAVTEREDLNVLPDFRDPDQCFSFLAGLPLHAPDDAHASLALMLDEMHLNPTPALNYLEVLETMRPAMSYIQGEVARRYLGRPIPPDDTDDSVFRRVIRLWQSMARSYAQVVQMGTPLEELRERLPTMCQRCIAYAGEAILAHFAARREVPGGLWRELHELYATAETAGVAASVVRDALNEADRRSSPASAYVALLLVSLASPYGLSVRQFEWATRWAQRFARQVDIRRPRGEAKASGFGVDLARDEGPRPVGQLAAGEQVRHLDAAALQPELRALRARLKDNVSPDALGLGGATSPQSARRLLLKVYRPWCAGGNPRRYRRRHMDGQARVWLGMDAVTESLMTLSVAHAGGAIDSFALEGAEQWRIVDQSAGGFHLQRWLEGTGLRHHMLAAVLPGEGEPPLLARVAWTMVESAGTLSAGFSVMPGVPKPALARRSVPPKGVSNALQGVILLAGVPRIGEEDSIVLPRGGFAEGLELDLEVDGALRRIRLHTLLQSGDDFERVSYAAA